MNLLHSTMRQALTGLILFCSIFMFFEPAIIRGATQAMSTFTISFFVSSELLISIPPNNITLSPSLGGLTGGTSNGETQIVVVSGSTTGFSLTLTASSSVGMIGNASSSQNIPAYKPTVTGVPDYDFNVPANRAYFGYTVNSSTTADLAPTFLTDGAACNTGSGSPALLHCWLNASTSPVTIVNRTSPTVASGSTTTLKFRVHINSNPSPVIPDDTYVATSTITATVN